MAQMKASSNKLSHAHFERDGRKRVVIEGISPQIDGGRFPIRRVVGEELSVEADVFSDGHDSVKALLMHTTDLNGEWTEVRMEPLGNDRWRADIPIKEMGTCFYTVHGLIDRYATWMKGLRKKVDAKQDVSVDLKVGSALISDAASRAKGEDRKELRSYIRRMEESAVEPGIALGVAESEILGRLIHLHEDRSLTTEYHKIFRVSVDRPKALFSTWYEFFPRSCGDGGHGTFKDCQRWLSDVAKMGFDVIYLPPIQPIGLTHRKGPNNSTEANPDDPGSPWAIGATEGGHKSIHPALGTMEDFERFVVMANELDIEIALDIAFQCSPDHPYVHEHPEWFRKRPDGTIQYAENPPKKYEDIVPFDFECEDWKALWEELKSVLEFWFDKGVHIFRIDNPHTKAFPFWEWVMREIRAAHPEVLYLAEAFTRPRVMERLAKVGFTQSYTYFTWRNTKRELTEYMTELTHSSLREYLRPNFWPNTPDILPEFLQYSGRAGFVQRFVLAATLSSNYGIYGPPYELLVDDALPDREEYAQSEKFEIRQWDFDKPECLRDLITRINHIRRENVALQTTWNVKFFDVDNDMLLFYGKMTPDNANAVFVIVNLDPHHTQGGWVQMPIAELGIEEGHSYLMHDLLGDGKFVWHGERNYVELNPEALPVHIFRLHRRLRRESDFDYYL